MKPTVCYAFDFDFTLAHFPDGLESLMNLAVSAGAPREVVDRVYASVVDSSIGFSHITFSSALAKEIPEIDADKLSKDICIWLGNAGIKLYDDVLTTFGYLQQHDIPAAIITAGNFDWQKKKIELVRIPLGEDRIFIVSPTEGKMGAIETLLQQGFDCIHYVDDRPLELDRIRDTYTHDRVTTYLMVRSDSLYKTVIPRHTHITITSLQEFL